LAGGRRKEERGKRRKEEGGRRKEKRESWDRRKEEGGGRKEEGDEVVPCVVMNLLPPTLNLHNLLLPEVEH
jgi:hypothetical protein